MPGTARLQADTPISVTELFTIGIGPSSSHTVGPMRAGARFADSLDPARAVTAIRVELFGSLALTGRGHATDTAVLLGLMGWQPETVDPERIAGLLADIRTTATLTLPGRPPIPFHEPTDLQFQMGIFLPGHPNAARFQAWDNEARVLEHVYFSIGGGAILLEGAPDPASADAPGSNIRQPYPFSSAAELLQAGDRHGLGIARIMLANEAAWRDEAATLAFLDDVRAAMMACIERGCRQGGILPGGLQVRRRAAALRHDLETAGPAANPAHIFEWVSLYALAVNEENAAGGRVVTAPTNGAAGVLPAVLKYYEVFAAPALPHPAPPGAAHIFLLTAAAIGTLYKKRASISAAEMGCQGEVGVACSMAAGALAAVLGGTNAQIENAAEIGMEHNLGLTCDPIGGLVQIPCIERNTMGAVKAINAAYLALRGDGAHIVSLDTVIETMRQTGEDMRSQYKETSLGGLAVNHVAC